jgi:hypothetical protein
MKNRLIALLTLSFLLVASYSSATDKGKTTPITNSYFPVNNSITLVYSSSFGESITKYSRDENYIISTSEADKFKYKQTLEIKENGVYAIETYQYLKIFLFIKKEALLKYDRPLLRFPLPLEPGMNWKWEGKEYSDGDSNTVTVTGKSICRESVLTKAGKFDAIKIESIIESSANAKNRVTEWYTEGIGLIKAKILIEGGGLMGVMRDILGYGTIEFELKEIRK